MSTIELDERTIRVTLTRAEKVAGLVADQTIPLDAVTSVELEGDPLKAPAGLRAPGLAIPGRTKIGTWRRRGRREFVCVRAGEPAVRIEASGAGYDAYLVSTDDAEALVSRLSARLTS